MIVNYYKDFANHYIVNIKKAQLEGEMRDYNPETLAYVLMGIANFVGIRYTMFEQLDNFDEIVEDIGLLYEKGLFFPK